MPLTQLFIEVPGLGDNSKNLEVEGAIAVGEKVAVSVSGLPADVSTSGSELRLRVLGPIGEDVATHGEWTYDAAKKTYATTLDLASVQAFRLFFPPPPPPRPHIYPRPPAPPMPLPPPGYDPVATAAAMQPPNAVNVRLVLELRDKSGSDSDSDGELVDASLIGTSSIRLNYWPADWQTATLIDLANGRVYSKEEVDALIAEEARQRGVADATETGARIAGDAETLASSKAYADEKAQELDSRKADLVDGKVPASQLPSYVDDVVEYDSRSAFPATGEKGKIYVALDTNKIYRWSGSEYVQVGGGDAPVLSVNGKTGAVVLSASDVGAVNRSGDTMYGGLTVRDLTVGLGRATGSTVGKNSVAEGEGPTASGYNSHAEGTYTTASGEGAHAEGCETVAQNSYEHAQGQFNASHTGHTAEEKTIHSIGVGTSVNARKNAVEVMLDGKVFVKGVGGYDGTNPTTATDLATAIPSTSDATPLMDGTGAAGTATTYARGDHQHPTDTTRMAANATGVDITVGGSGPYGGANIALALTDIYSHKADTISLALFFSEGSTYAVGDYCTYLGQLYKCTTAVTTPGAWNAANWTAVAVTDEMGADTPLPFEAECEYITVPAGACIATGVMAYDASLGFDITFRIPASPTPGEGAFRCGTWTGNAASSYQLFINSATEIRLVRYNTSVSSVSNSPFLGSFGTASIVGAQLSNGSASTPSLTSTVVATPLEFYIAGLGTDSDPIKCVSDIDVSGANLSIFGAPIRAFVPVRIGTVGYLYDKVSGRLFGSAVGSIPLVPGPDKAQPTITTPGRIVELTPAIRYAFASPTPSVSGTAATVACEDRAINDFTVATGITSLTITPPAAVTGRARDFFCRVTLTDSSLPTVTLSGGTIDIGASEVAGMTQGVNLLMFTEIASGHWLASRRSAS